jgi:apolipoprotein N-acyltransferase
MPSLDTSQKMTWRKRVVLACLGVALALGQAPFDLSLIYFVILPFLGWIMRNVPNAKIGFGVGWWTAFGYFALTLVWIVEPFLVEPQITGWMAPFALGFMAAGLALFWATAFALAVKIMPAGAGRVVVLALTWALFEYLRANIFTGFPWGHLSYGLINLPIAQLAAFVGIHGMGLIVLLICFLPAIFAPRIWDGAFWATLAFFILSGIGQWWMHGPVAMNPSETLVRVAQPNAAQHLKWRRDMAGVFYGRLLGYTSAQTADRPDVVIWPETAIPYVYRDSLPVLQEIATASGPKTSVIAGIVRTVGDRPRNTMLFLDPAGGPSALYDKQHLVPFGEYMPFAALIERIGLSGLTGLAGRFVSGEGSRVISGQNLPNFLALICYEAIFPQYARNTENRPEWIVHITNDAWFGEFSGPHQHLAQAQMRAIEQGLPLVRSANTGISAMIDPHGRIVQQLDLGTAGYFDVYLPAASPPTVYARFGEWVWLISALMLLFGTIIHASRSAREID